MNDLLVTIIPLIIICVSIIITIIYHMDSDKVLDRKIKKEKQKEKKEKIKETKINTNEIKEKENEKNE